MSGQLVAGVVAAPLFVGAFTWMGAARPGYRWRQHSVSSLACGRHGWMQRANFIVTGLLYCAASRGLGPASRSSLTGRVIPAMVSGVGIGLIGSGMFVTDPVAGFPLVVPDNDAADQPEPGVTVPSRSGMLHNLFALPIFVGIPVAGLASALAAAREHDHRWA